jgi:nucleoside-diphosphate-sugar epimerase
MPAAFVTGGTGFVGWHVAKALRASGWTVRALARGGPARRTGLDELGVELVPGDLSASTMGDVVRALQGCSAVVHAAGLVKARSLADYRDVNVLGTERLLAAGEKACPDAVFVYVSSQAAAGPAGDGRPVVEGDPARPVSDYGISKLEGERAVGERWKGAGIVLRPGVLYGPRDRGLLTYFRMARKGVVPVPAGRSRIQIGSVEQAALGIARAAGRRDLAGRIGFLCDPEPVTVADLARLVARAGDLPVRFVKVPNAAVRLAGALETLRETVTRESRPFNADKARELLAGDWLCDPAPMRRDLGLPEPPPLSDGLRKTWEWYRKEGWVAA